MGSFATRAGSEGRRKKQLATLGLPECRGSDVQGECGHCSLKDTGSSIYLIEVNRLGFFVDGQASRGFEFARKGFCMGKFRDATLLAMALVSWYPARSSPSAPARLNNHGVRVQWNRDTGAMVKMSNLLTEESYGTEALPFEIETSAGTLTATAVQAQPEQQNGIEFGYTFPGVRVRVQYRAPAGQDFLEKTITITNTAAEPLLIRKIVAEQIKFEPAFGEVRAHYDPSQFHWLINVFLRGTKGGFYFGMENPVYEYWTKGSTPGSSWLQLDFTPNVTVAPGQTYTSEPSFLGSFRKEQIYLFREIGKLREALHEPHAIPSAMSFDPEILDWGEVWAMQDFIRAIEPPHDTERKGFYVRVVGEVGGRKTGNAAEDKNVADHVAFGANNVAGSRRLVDEVAALGHVPHLEWATEWFGVAGYGKASEERRLENAGPGDAMPVNPYWLEVVRYGWEKGIQTGIFETISRDFARQRAEWKVLKPDGTPWTWGKPAEPVNCWGNPAYANWRLQVTDQAVADYKLYMVAWDSFAPADWAWLGYPAMQTSCYAKNHDHLPGDIRYANFRNVMEFTGELQSRHPKLALRVASGLTTDYPWVLKNLIEYHPDFYDGETGASFWTSYNFRFLPMYKSGILLSATSQQSFEYLLLRSIANSDHFMLWSDAVPIALQDRAFWDRWLTWADSNIEYLRVGRTLFREPWGDKFVASLPPNLEGRLPYPEAMLNGSAHCINDRGYLFLFNPSRGSRTASILINHWLGLTQGTHFVIRTLTPETARSYGPYALGQEFRIEVPQDSAMVLQIEPAAGGRVYGRPRVSAAVPVDKAFLHWDEIPWKELEDKP